MMLRYIILVILSFYSTESFSKEERSKYYIGASLGYEPIFTPAIGFQFGVEANSSRSYELNASYGYFKSDIGIERTITNNLFLGIREGLVAESFVKLGLAYHSVLTIDQMYGHVEDEVVDGSFKSSIFSFDVSLGHFFKKSSDKELIYGIEWLNFAIPMKKYEKISNKENIASGELNDIEFGHELSMKVHLLKFFIQSSW